MKKYILLESAGEGYFLKVPFIFNTLDDIKYYINSTILYSNDKRIEHIQNYSRIVDVERKCVITGEYISTVEYIKMWIKELEIYNKN